MGGAARIVLAFEATLGTVTTLLLGKWVPGMYVE